MLNYDNLTENQQGAVMRLYEHNATLLHADMGAGKTVVMLTALADLLADGVIKSPLVIAPKKICESVWRQECEKWEHLKCLNVVYPFKTSYDVEAAMQSAHSGAIVLCNFENVAKLFEHSGAKIFDALVVDEHSRLGEVGGKTFKVLRKHKKQFSYRVGMTGTPAHESWTKLYGQCLILDDGAALGTSKDRFLRGYFYPTDYEQRNWELKPDSDVKIMSRLNALLYSLPDYRGELPELKIYDHFFDMSPTQTEAYKTMAKDRVLEHDGIIFAAKTAADLQNKLLQIASGFLYDEDGVTHYIGDGSARDDALEDVLTHNALGVSGAPTLLAYWFNADGERLGKDFAGVEYLSGPEKVEKWNTGDISLLALHPASAAHGLNLAQGGCNMVLYGQFWSNDRYQQLIARLWRRGQIAPVNVHRLIARGTVDEIACAKRDEKQDGALLFKQHVENLGGSVD